MNLVQKETGESDFNFKHEQNSQITGIINETENARQKPNLMRINADNQQKKFMIVFWVIFVVFIIAISLIGKFLPPSTIDVTNAIGLQKTGLGNCINPSLNFNTTLKCVQFNEQNPTIGFIVKNLKQLNQFLVLQVSIIPKDPLYKIEISQNVTYKTYTIDKVRSGNINSFTTSALIDDQTVLFKSKISASSSNPLNSQIVDPYISYVGFINDMSSPDLFISMTFDGSFTQFGNVDSIYLQGFVVDQRFTVFTIVIRYVFFAIALVTGFLYIKKYRTINAEDKIYQQKMVFVLSILVLFFNDPLYPITVLKQNMFSSVLSIFFVISFIVYIIYLWIIFFDRIFYEQGQKQTQQTIKPKKIYIFILFMLTMILYCLYAQFRFNRHPIVPSQNLTTGSFALLFLITGLIFFLGIAYILTQYFRICMHKQQSLMWRNQIFMMYSILFIFTMCVFFAANNIIGPYTYNGSGIMMLYGFMNLYVWFLQYMYSPAPHQLESQDGKLHSDQRMSVNTMEFNDLNIDLDNNLSFMGYKQSPKVNAAQLASPQQNNINRQFQQQYDHFSIDESQVASEKPQDHVGIQSYTKEQQYPHQIVFRQEKQVDFFNQNKNQTKVDEINKNGFKIDEKVNKNDDSLFDDDQQPNDKKHSDFGSFSLQ